MNRNFAEELRAVVKKYREEKPAEQPAEVEKVFNVVRCFLPPTDETPVFFNLSEHTAKILVYRILKSRVVDCNGVNKAMYYDLKEVAS